MRNMNQLLVQVYSPTRLDRYLRKYYPTLTQGVIERAVRTGQIKLAHKKVKTSYRVNTGDIILLAHVIFEFGNTSKQEKKIFPSSVKVLASKLLSDYLIYQSEYCIAINKPSGLAVQSGSKISLSIDDALQYLNQNMSEEYKLVHRLDKNTSGVLLIAKGNFNSIRIANAFKNKIIKKLYIAVLQGCPMEMHGEISNYISKVRSGAYELVQENKEKGKLAITQYRVISTNGLESVIEFQPLTGRMHQLRFHSKFLGCPIVGDTKYGGRKNYRMLLHAKKIILPQSVFGKETIIDTSIDFLL